MRGLPLLVRAEAGDGLPDHLGGRRLCAGSALGLQEGRLKADADLRNEKISYKVREHSLQKIPVILAVGKKEAAERTVSVRRFGSQAQEVMGLDALVAQLADEATPPDVRRARAKG